MSFGSVQASSLKKFNFVLTLTPSFNHRSQLLFYGKLNSKAEFLLLFDESFLNAKGKKVHQVPHFSLKSQKSKSNRCVVKWLKPLDKVDLDLLLLFHTDSPFSESFVDKLPEVMRFCFLAKTLHHFDNFYSSIETSYNWSLYSCFSTLVKQSSIEPLSQLLLSKFYYRKKCFPL